MLNTQVLAKQILKSGDLEKKGFSLKSLFEIRDSLYILDKYGFCPQDLLREIENYIQQTEELICRR